jgi:hypothetical protein
MRITLIVTDDTGLPCGRIEKAELIRQFVDWFIAWKRDGAPLAALDEGFPDTGQKGLIQ